MMESDRAPKVPGFSRASFRGTGVPVPSVTEAGEVKYFTLARMALFAALRDAGIGEGDEVLMPAYHCIVMVDAVVCAGATPVFYRVQPSTAFDLEDIEKRITPATRALLVTHYFGFPQVEIEAARKVCDARNLVLIEDCAHALLGGCEEKAFRYGTFGDYAIASPWKFLPAIDGGCLISSRRSLARVPLKSAGMRYQLKMVVNVIEFALEYGRLNAFRGLRVLLKAKDRVRDAVRAEEAAPALQSTPGASGPKELSVDFEPFWVDKRASWCSRAITKCAAWNGIAQLRRRYYQTFDSSLRGLDGCRPLFAELPSGVVPQVYPLLVDEPEIVFPQLKLLGVPIIRFGEFLWDHMDRSLCPVSLELSRRVFQFPCHQDLRVEEIDWIIRTVREVVARVHSGESKTGDGKQQLGPSTNS